MPQSFGERRRRNQSAKGRWTDSSSMTTHFLTEMRLDEEIVENWTLVTFIRIFKKGDRKFCDNYRRISFLVVASKILTRMIVHRIQAVIDRHLCWKSKSIFGLADRSSIRSSSPRWQWRNGRSTINLLISVV